MRVVNLSLHLAMMDSQVWHLPWLRQFFVTIHRSRCSKTGAWTKQMGKWSPFYCLYLFILPLSIDNSMWAIFSACRLFSLSISFVACFHFFVSSILSYHKKSGLHGPTQQAMSRVHDLVSKKCHPQLGRWRELWNPASWEITQSSSSRTMT